MHACPFQGVGNVKGASERRRVEKEVEEAGLDDGRHNVKCTYTIPGEHSLPGTGAAGKHQGYMRSQGASSWVRCWVPGTMDDKAWLDIDTMVSTWPSGNNPGSRSLLDLLAYVGIVAGRPGQPREGKRRKHYSDANRGGVVCSCSRG